MGKSLVSTVIIPFDIVIQILGPLPLKSLHKFKWVSKSWHSLITQEIFPRILQTQFIGFFHRIPAAAATAAAATSANGIFTCNTEVGNNNGGATSTTTDPNLNFLPNVSKPVVLDCCNGLVLCEAWNPDRYYVCNPVNKSWTELMGFGVRPDVVSLDFDPWVSPHFRLAAFVSRATSVLVSVYHSEAKGWVQRRMVHCSFNVVFPFGDCHCTFWNRALYVYGNFWGEPVGGGATPGEDYRVVRFGLSEGDVGFEFVKFLRGTKRPRNGMHIGGLGGMLCLVGLDGLQVGVWTLTDDEKEWVRVHRSSISSLVGFVPDTKPQIVGFHPLRNAILILYASAIFAYDLVGMSSVEICRIGRKPSAAVFPFITCSSALTEDRINPLRQEDGGISKSRC